MPRTVCVAYSIEYARELGLNRLSEDRAERCLRALEWCDTVLGPKWLVESYGHSSSLGVVTEVIQTHDDWHLIEALAGTESLLGRLRGSETAQRRAAMLELFVVARLVEQDLQVVLEPTVPSGRKPDCSLSLAGRKVLVEISERGHSQALTDAFAFLNALATVAAAVAPERRNSVHLLRPPSAVERAELLCWLPTRTGVREQFRDLALFESRAEGDESPADPDVRRAMEGSIALLGRGIWSMPLSDAAADQLVDDEARQLPPGECGVLCLDITGAGLVGDQWEVLVRSRLRPKFNTRVSAVVLLVRYAGDHGFDTRVRVLTNPYAAVPATTELLDVLRRLGSTAFGEPTGSQWRG